MKSSTGFCSYSEADVSSSSSGHPTIQGFVSDPDMFNFLNNQFLPQPNFYHHHQPDHFTSISSENNLTVGAHDSATWQEKRLTVDDSSSLRCVFPCEGNYIERPSQGLSLSLSSTNPSSIGFQSFDQLRQPSRDQVKNSKFLVPVQQLLNEFCSLGPNHNINDDVIKQKSHKNRDSEQNGVVSSIKKQHSVIISSIEFVELQRRKTKLLSMLEEVERRYRHYSNQMKELVWSFEAVAGYGAGRVYSALAMKAMSRHFRCLKDGILDEIECTRKAMGEKLLGDAGGTRTTRGETPKLRVIDQALRQQRALQQINMMETQPWRPQRGLPDRSVSVLRAWLFEHFLHPYPSDVDKHILARQAGLSRSQVSNWFINARVRLWKPMVEEMYLEEEARERSENNINNVASSYDGGRGTKQHDEERNNNIIHATEEDQKPTPPPARLLGNNNVNDQQQHHHQNHLMDPAGEQCVGRVTDDNTLIGSMEIDFSSYAAHQYSSSSGMVSYNTAASNFDQNNIGTHHQNFNDTRDGVSLTLGLQQQIVECEPVVQYSLLEGQGQNMSSYRNLVGGTQLLHDLAG